MNDAPPSVAVVVVNFNAGDALARCVESVLAQGMAVRIVIVDNASADDSADRVAELYGRRDDVTVLRNAANIGFARAVNQAAAEPVCRDAGFLLVLNPDCEFMPGALRRLVAALEAHPEADLAGPLVIDRHGQAMRGTLRRFPDPWRSLMQFSGLWRLGRHASVFQGVEPVGELPAGVTAAEAVSGACMLLRRDAFERLGGLDPDYGLHCEDLDLMYRLRAQGRVNLFVPEARVYHLQGLSSRSRPVWVHWQKHRGMQRFFTKFQAADYAWPLRGLVVTGIWARFALTLPLVLLRR
ncbi:MAG: glycosyltransferase family 2 protein [Xanthomonadales bacterium]